MYLFSGPVDFRQYLSECYIDSNPICQNGGECVFNLYEGKICDCKPGYYGQLCENQGTAQGWSDLIARYSLLLVIILKSEISVAHLFKEKVFSFFNQC